ncbi:MAG: porin [Bacteroidota bacterium]
MKKVLLITTLILFSLSLFSQSTEAYKEAPELKLSGFLDVFYVYDFNEPQENSRQGFFYNHNRHNEFNLNLGLLKLAVEHPKYRANLALQTGTYVVDNLSAEPQALQNIFEANIGFALDKQNKLWIDAGIMPSHIGFESAVSMDNPTLTRSILAENSPFFLTGAKLTYSPNETLEFAALLVNGWQRIQRTSRNSGASFGTMIYYTPNDKTSINWSTFIGSDYPDVIRRMRYFSNLYGQFELTETLFVTLGFDIGIEENTSIFSENDIWLSPIGILQFTLSEHWKTTLRVEHYQDKAGVMISNDSRDPFQTTGLSWNLDYAPAKNINWRFEARYLNSEEPFFVGKNSETNKNFFLATSIAIKFGEVLSK